MHGACHGDDSLDPLSDADRLLLFEWHAAHLRSWIDTFASGKLTLNFPRGASTEDFHRTAMTSALIRKFYTPSEAIALPHVVRSIESLYTGDDVGLLPVLRDIRRGYRQFLAMPMTSVDENGSESTGSDLAYDLMYGLLIHGDVDRGKRLRRRGRAVLHASAIGQRGWEPIVQGLLTIQKGRDDGTLAIGDALETLW